MEGDNEAYLIFCEAVNTIADYLEKIGVVQPEEQVIAFVYGCFRKRTTTRERR